MESKYYTPTIEEFYVGFEYEMESLIVEPPDGSYIKCIYGEYNMAPERFKSLLTHYNSIRVKYLDHLDIESLNWVEGSYKSIKGYTKGQRLLTINFNYEEPVVDISLFPIFKDQGLSRIFRGTIKNKSELKILMKQLGIDV